nr:NEAT domain-containing protein [Bacillus safensis]
MVWKADSDSTSTANTYFEKPAKLVVKDGKIKAQVTLTNSSWITSFKTFDQGVYKDAKVISTNTAANKRTVEFNVNSLTEVVPAKVSVTVPLPSDIQAITTFASSLMRHLFNRKGGNSLDEKKDEAVSLHGSFFTGTYAAFFKRTGCRIKGWYILRQLYSAES